MRSHGLAGHKGQTSEAALSQTVKTKLRCGESGLENPSHDLLRAFAALKPLFRALANGLRSHGSGWLTARTESSEFPAPSDS